jgi:outer membrane protein, heavy metal efflux system
MASSGTMKCLGFVLALLSGGCATYQAKPLAPVTLASSLPDASLISIEASKIDRPFLTPQTIDLSAPLTLNAVAVIATIANPDLKAQRAKAGVADAQLFSARLLPDPSFQMSLDNVLAGPDTLLGFGGQLGFDISALRSRAAARASGEALRQQVRLDIAWAEWQIASDARLQAVKILSLTAQLKILQISVAASADLFGRTQRAAGRGDLAASEVDSRRATALDAADAARSMERDLGAAKYELNRLLGVPPETVIRLADLPMPVATPAADILTSQALTRRLDLQALRAGYDSAEAEMRKSIIAQFPNLSLTLAGGRDTGGNYTLGPQIGFNLPLWNRNRGEIAVVDSTRDQLRAEYEARLFQTRAQIAASVNGLALIRTQAEALRAQLPAIERYAVATRRAATRGDLSRATAESAEQTLRDRQSALGSLDQHYAEQSIALELLSGGPAEGWTK